MIQLLSKRDIVSILRHVKDRHSPFCSVPVDRAGAGLWMATHVDSVPAHFSRSRIVMLQAFGVSGDTVRFHHSFHSRRRQSLQEFSERVEHSIGGGRDGAHPDRLPHWLLLSVGAITSYAVSRDIFVAELTD